MFMEGMVSKEILLLHKEYVLELGECSLMLDMWGQCRVVRLLLKVTHGQFYHNVRVHDTTAARVAATARKVAINSLSKTSLT